MTLDNGKKVKTLKQWEERREQMKRILEYYAVGLAPPPPGNVKGTEISSQMLMDGKVKYRLVHLTFGPNESLSLDIGIFTPAQGGPFPALVSPSGTPPGAKALPRLADGANQGRNQDVLLVVGPVSPAEAAANAQRMRAFFRPRTAEQIAETNPAIAHGFAFVTFNNNDCGEDTTLRLPDGSWAYRTTRFFPAYPNYDWGLLRAWAWGASRIVDYLVTDPVDRQEQADHHRGFAHGQGGADCGRIRRSFCDGGAGGKLRRRNSRVSLQRLGARSRRQRGTDGDGAQVSQLVFAAPAPVLGTAGQVAVR